MAKPDNRGQMMVIIATFITFCVAIVLMIVSGFGDGIVFLTDTITAHYMFYAPFDVAPWVHFLWFPVGIWQLVWMLYGMSTLCRRDPATGLSMYCAPGCIPLSTYSMFFCAITSNVCMQASLSHGYLNMAFGFSFLISATLFIALYFSLEKQYENFPYLIANGRGNEIPLMIGMHHNGLAVYAGWADAQMFIMMGKVFKFYTSLNSENAGVTVLILFALYYTIGAVIELTLWDKYMRNVLTANIVTVFVMIGITTQSVNWNIMTPLSYIILVVLLTLSIVAIVRIYLTITRNRRDAKLGKALGS